MKKTKGKFRITATAQTLRNGAGFTARASVVWDDAEATYDWYCDSGVVHATAAEAEAQVMEMAEQWCESGAADRGSHARTLK